MKERSSPNFRLDEQVYLTMGAVALLSFFIFAFRLVTHKPCQPIILHIQANSYERGNMISFKAETAGGKDFVWDFGDGASVEETDPSTVHRYGNAGKYTVQVTVNGTCTEFQNVVITEARITDDLSLNPTFSGPDTIYINQLVTYEDHTSLAKSWEWHFEDPVRVDANTRSASFQYKSPGEKKITLMVNGRRDLVVSRNIYVIDPEAERIRNTVKARESRPKAPSVIILPSGPSTPPLSTQTSAQQENVPPKKEEEKPKAKAPVIAGPQMESLLMEVVDGSKHAEDFTSYLNNNLSMSVSYNSKSVSFISMCESLKGLKRKKIKAIHVKLYPDASTGFITYMIVMVDTKKGFLGL